MLGVFWGDEKFYLVYQGDVKREMTTEELQKFVSLYFIFFNCCFFCDFTLILEPVKSSDFSEVTFYSGIESVLHHKHTGLDERTSIYKENLVQLVFLVFITTILRHEVLATTSKILKKKKKGQHMSAHFCLLTTIWI